MYYNRNDLGEGIDLAKSKNSKESKASHYWFVNNGFIYNGCHDLLMLCLNISNITIITAKGIDYHCIIHDISKSDASHLLEHSVLGDGGYIMCM